jgi:glutamate-1-semialdehyde 2,1-aminomutase
MLPREKSRAAFARACRVIPGGVNSPARAFGAVGGEPLVIARGERQFLYDLDGNRLLDYVGSWGPHILGHGPPAVREALRQALARGTSFGAPTELETELAEQIVSAVPSLEKVRMVNSGTEATMSAIRVARGFTRRNVVIKFAGCYHGHVDSLLVQAGSGALTHGVPSSPGVPRGCTQDTVCLRYNDAEELADTLAGREGEVAAVIVEPVVGNMGCVLPQPGFLQECRDLCTRYGVVLIFDEVMTGFRLAYGGAQELYGVTPDLTTLGKIVGGGLPVGAYGGRAEIMDCVSPVGPVYQAGTLSGNPLAMASGLAMLRELERTRPYDQLADHTTRLVRGLSDAAEGAGIPHTVAHVGSMFTLFFHAEPVTSYDVAVRCDTTRFARYFQGMLERGVYLPCSQFEANFVSTCHTEQDLAATVTAASEVFRELSER